MNQQENNEQSNEEVPELPQGAPVEQEPQQDEITPDENEGDVKIGNFTFKSHAEAAAHIEKLEREKLELGAYNAGLQEGFVSRNQGQAPAPEQEEDLLEGLDANEIYDKPADFLKKFANKIEAKVQKRTDAVSAQKQSEQKVWSDFSENYPELAHVQDYAKHKLITQYWHELSPLRTEQAMAILATRVKQELRIGDSVHKELPNKGRASTGQQTNVTSKKKEEPELDFAAQINQNRQKRLKKS